MELQTAIGRLSTRLALVFALFAAAPLLLVVCFLIIAQHQAWVVVTPAGSTAVGLVFALLVGGGVVAGALLFALLRRRVTQPIRDLRQRAERLGTGDFEPDLALAGDDELSELARTINRVAERLANAQGGLEGMLDNRTRELGRALGELQLLKKLNEAVIHNIPSGVAIMAGNGSLLYVNSTFERITGIHPTCLGRPIFSMSAAGPFDRVDWVSELRAVADPSEPRRNVTIETGQGLHRRVYQYSLVPLPPADMELPLQLVGDEVSLRFLAPPDCGRECEDCVARSEAWLSPRALLIIEDITEEQRVEAQLIQQEKLAALGQLSAGVAHEIRNPLSAISGAAFYIREVLGDDDPDLADLEDYVALIMRNVDRAQRIVTDILNFARPTDSEVASQDLAELVRQTLAILSKSLVNQGVELEQRLADDLLVRCRGETVKQALLNLIVNALQAMPEGGSLTLTAERCPDGCAMLAVADTGVGIPPEQLNDIFNPFFTTKPAGQGTGLGLSIARQAVEQDGGRLEVESVVGQGTCFRIFLPCQPRPLGDDQSPAEVAEVSEGRHT